MADSYCPAPFRSLYFNAGKMRPCCWFDKDEVAYRGSLADAGRAFRSKEIEGVREAMRGGKPVAGCERCVAHERIGGKSHRHFWLEREFTDLLPRDPNAQLKALDLYMGNLCNLRCVTCSGADSSAWHSDEAQMTGRRPLGGVQRADLGRIDWDALSEVEWIKFAGGEVLLMSEHRRLLEEIVARNLAGKISLNYVTNGTVGPEDFVELWSRFRGVRVILSLDGVGAVAEYARHPSRWDEVERNVRAFVASPGVTVEANSVVSLINAYHLPELHEWWRKVAGESPQFFRLLDRPSHLRVQRFPSEARAQVRRKLEGVNALAPVVQALGAAVEPGFDESLEWIGRLDRLRGNDFFAINSWLRPR